MAICIACDADVDIGEAEVGDTIPCLECGAEMEVISLRPLELELVDDTDDEVGTGDDDDADDDEPEEEDEVAR